MHLIYYFLIQVSGNEAIIKEFGDDADNVPAQNYFNPVALDHYIWSLNVSTCCITYKHVISLKDRFRTFTI